MLTTIDYVAHITPAPYRGTRAPYVHHPPAALVKSPEVVAIRHSRQPQKTKAMTSITVPSWLAVVCFAFVAVLIASNLSGCDKKGMTDFNSGVGGASSPITEFQKPSVSDPIAPPVQVVNDGAKAVQANVAKGTEGVAKSTPETFAKDKPGLLEFFGKLKGQADQLVADAAIALRAAQLKDRDVVELSKLLVDARDKVNQREKTIVEIKAEAAKKIGELEKERDASNAEARKDLNRMLVSSVAFGGVLILGGLAAAVWVMPRMIGFAAMGAGVAVASLALGAIYFGRELAMIAVTGGVIGLVALVVVVIKTLRGDAQSIIQTVEQARIVGKLDLGEKEDPGSLAAMFDMGQTDGAKALVEIETE